MAPILKWQNKFVMWRVLLFLVSVTMLGATLTDLREVADRLQSQKSSPPNWRGESPLLTSFKHQLIEWVESKLPSKLEDPAAFAMTLNKELRETGLICPEGHCGADNNLGLLGELKLASATASPDWLIVVTSVGIVCECDQSIYLYEKRGGHWIRQVESEQNGYGKAEYRPQWVEGTLSEPDAQGERMFLTTGFNPACWSVWQEGYFRLFRIGTQTAKILDWEQSMLNIGEEIHERVEPRDVLIEYGSTGIEPGFVRRHVLHFEVEGDRTRRIEPIALQPEDFVDEWLSLEWPKATAWSVPRLEVVHSKLRGDAVDGYAYAQQCTERPREWQVAVEFEKLGTFFFLIEDRGEHRYRMIDASTQRQQGCPGEQRIDYDRHPTLFPASNPNQLTN